MLEISICDDDKIIIEKIRDCIIAYTKDICSITTYNSGEQLLRDNKKFDVIFLDIDMTGINGIETAKKIRNYDKSVKIIYVTSYTDYQNLAFSVHAFGYLNKPIQEYQIHNQLDEVLSYSEEENEDILDFITLDGVIRVSPREIYFFEYINRSVKMVTTNNTFILKEKITTIADKMDEYNFVVPHKSFTVNLLYVKSIKGYDISMVDGSIIPLSQKKSVDFRNKFNIFLENRINK